MYTPMDLYTLKQYELTFGILIVIVKTTHSLLAQIYPFHQVYKIIIIK